MRGVTSMSLNESWKSVVVSCVQIQGQPDIMFDPRVLPKTTQDGCEEAIVAFNLTKQTKILTSRMVKAGQALTAPHRGEVFIEYQTGGEVLCILRRYPDTMIEETVLVRTYALPDSLSEEKGSAIGKRTRLSDE